MILTIGFEGVNRVGKGTQIALLSDYLDKKGVPHLAIRGDGSRDASGNEGDPRSSWWDNANQFLRTTARLADWDVASYRLAREYIVWRDRYLPRKVEEGRAGFGCLLVDRTVLSRSMVALERGLDVLENLYPDRVRGVDRGITLENICPDVIFNLTAPKQVLLARLDATDPKYDFRRLLIERKCGWYEKAPTYFPMWVLQRCVSIPATDPPEVVARGILAVLLERFAEFGKLEVK